MGHNHNEGIDGPKDCCEFCRIERLESEVKRLRESLETISHLSGYAVRYVDDYGDIARQALSPQEKL